MSTSISATEAQRNLGDFLDRIQHTGESFILQKNERPVAVLGPIPESRTITLKQLWELWEKLPSDPSFADDLSRVNQADVMLTNPWD